jgi:hypothetical protein
MLNDYYAPRAQYVENGKGRVTGSDAARRIDPSVFNLPRTQSSGQTGNPSQTCFHTKQAARSQRVSHTDLPPSVLWCNQQTEAHLVFEAQTKKPSQ